MTPAPVIIVAAPFAWIFVALLAAVTLVFAMRVSR